jgi:DNA-binding GntR family transcriptional regulator
MPFSGTRVASPSLRMLGEMYEVRAVLEGLAARRAAAAATPAQIEELRATVEDGARSVRDAKPMAPQTGSPTPHRFHNKIAEIAGSLELARLLGREIWRFSIQIHRKWNRSPERLQASIREHEHILVAIEAADEELAEMLMRRHIAAAYKGQQA